MIVKRDGPLKDICVNKSNLDNGNRTTLQNSPPSKDISGNFSWSSTSQLCKTGSCDVNKIPNSRQTFDSVIHIQNTATNSYTEIAA